MKCLFYLKMAKVDLNFMDSTDLIGVNDNSSMYETLNFQKKNHSPQSRASSKFAKK